MLAHILNHAHKDLEKLRHQRLFFTGGTGFFGKWLLEALVTANQTMNLDLKVTVLSRNPIEFLRQHPHLISPYLNFIAGDVRSYELLDEPFEWIIHGATPASAQLNSENPALMSDIILSGTKQVLTQALRSKTKHFLFISSGAVYGPQPPDQSQIPESYQNPHPLSHANAYGIAKDRAEKLCMSTFDSQEVSLKIARCFAFSGPHLPLNSHFAIGNFVRDALQNRNIKILGDGSPRRSYLDASDLVIWLLRILAQDKTGVYNVGSDEDLSISEVALKVAEASSHFGFRVKTEIRSPLTLSTPVQRYIPDIQKAQKELGLTPLIALSEGLLQWMQWLLK